MLRWSIATVCMGGTLETKLAAAARAGFRTIEIFENDLTFFSGKPRQARAMADDLGLEIVALQPLRDFEGAPEAMRARNFDRAERKFDLMDELGVNLLCVCSSVAEDSSGETARCAADFAELADRAVRRGFRIGYEALAWGKHVRDWQQAWDIVHAADRANLGIVLDSFHIHARRNDVASIATLPADRIALVQLADAPGILMDPMSLSRHHRCFPGQGDWPLDKFLEACIATNYSGAISLEIFNDQFRGAPAAAIARDGMRSLQTVGETLDKARAARGEAPLNISRALPKPARISGIEFIEFAAGPAQSTRLETELAGLGFQRVAHHKSKDVDLYRQNDINIVVNREQDGFAHSFYLVHGASVCAMALRYDDPARALERANALGAPTYRGRIGPGEALIPAVAGVENSLIYLVKAGAHNAWDQDFDFLETAANPGPLERIDHISNVVRRSEFLSWLTFYKAVLGFTDEPQVELADPYGAFYSRVIRSEGGEVRIPINIADGGTTAVSRFIETFGGGGVQQIALSTRDLFAFVEQARARGVRFLEIPDNYYEDLSARYDIAPETLDRMRALGVLYDRHKGGEFLHIYTTMFDQRFFFEILERRDYDLFGAANTPVRLAAQAAEYERAQGDRAMLELE